MLMRKLFWLAACFVIMGCGKNRHSYLQWPTTLGGLEGFSDSQRENVMDAIGQLNARIRRTIVAPAALQDSGAEEPGSPIFIRFEDKIPERTSIIAGRATVDDEKCIVQIASVVADSPELLVPVLWHEIGHCAGLDHDPKDGELMYKMTYSMRRYDEATIERFFTHVLEASGLSSPL
jgi:hypothetical protein